MAKKVLQWKLDKNSQGPFFAEDIHQYTQQTLSTGLSKRGKHKNNKETTCDVPADNKSKLSNAQDEMFGSSSRAGDVHTIDKIVPRQHRSTDTPISYPTDTSISNNNIITNNINKFSTRKRAYPALDLANPMENIRVDKIPTRKSSRISSLNSEKDIANKNH